jgi:ParB-like chromosome segregation protein Spo0J
MPVEKAVFQLKLDDLKPTESVVGAEIKIAEIKAVIEENGWFDHAATAIKDELNETIYLLDGHHRFAAAQELGLTEVPVLLVKFEDLPKYFLYYNSMEDIRTAANNVKKFR